MNKFQLIKKNPFVLPSRMKECRTFITASFSEHRSMLFHRIEWAALFLEFQHATGEVKQKASNGITNKKINNEELTFDTCSK